MGDAGKEYPEVTSLETNPVSVRQKSHNCQFKPCFQIIIHDTRITHTLADVFQMVNHVAMLGGQITHHLPSFSAILPGQFLEGHVRNSVFIMTHVVLLSGWVTVEIVYHPH